jgi:hypothetical protein
MASYKVISSNFALGNQGDTVDSEALVGCNIPALIEGEHIAEIVSRKKDSVTE